MAKFKFTLQNFLNIKEKLEEQKKLEYGSAIAALEIEKRKKFLLVNERNMNISEFRKNIAKKVDANAFISYNNYIDFLKRRIIKQEAVIQKAEEFAEKKRMELVAAVQERKMYEKLKEKAKETFMKEEQIAEQKLVDEIVSYRYSN